MDQDFSFLLWPKREARVPWKQGRKIRGSITCPTDRANEASEMFIIWLSWLFRFWKGDRELEVRTATYGPGIDQSQHAKSVRHIIKYLITFQIISTVSSYFQTLERQRIRLGSVRRGQTYPFRQVFSDQKTWSFKPSFTQAQTLTEELNGVLQQDLNYLQIWARENRLSIHPIKTDAVLFGTHKELRQITNSTLFSETSTLG